MANDTQGTQADESGGEGGSRYSPEQLETPNEPAAQPDNDVNLDLVLDVPVTVSLRVGAADMSIRDLVKLVEGSVVALDRQAGEAMDVLVNGTLVAHGEIVVVDDRFGVRLTDVVSPAERIRKIS